MVAWTEGSRDTGHTLDYNEQKLKQAKARFLGALNYWQDSQELTRREKISRLHALNMRSKRVKVHTAHISLNFHPDDVMTDRQMKIIAAGFLKKIGFADQPALLYRHVDAGHPHCHIVTSNVRPDGKRISNDLRAPRNLRKVCEQLEQTYHLVPAIEYAPDGRRVHRVTGSENPTILRYGQNPTKTEMGKVLKHVLKEYTYTSLHHLNAALKLYNVTADRGSPQSHLYKIGGLYYRMLDGNGKKIGAPIKASAFEDRPTMKYLEQRFEENKLRLQTQKLQNDLLNTKTSIEFNLLYADSLEKLRQKLLSEKVLLAPDKNNHFYYISMVNKTVYSETDLGKTCAAAAILQQVKKKQQQKLEQELRQELTHRHRHSL